MRFIGVLLAALPVAFGVFRAATTGTDFRYLWVALASSLAAALMVARGRHATPQSSRLVARMAVTVLAAAGASGVTGFAVGGRSVPAVLMVSVGFALCSGIGLSLAAPPRAV